MQQDYCGALVPQSENCFNISHDDLFFILGYSYTVIQILMFAGISFYTIYTYFVKRVLRMKKNTYHLVMAGLIITACASEIAQYFMAFMFVSHQQRVWDYCCD